MLYCSLDIETTGLDPENSDILQFAAVLDNLSNPEPVENLPRFEAIFVKDGPLMGDPYAFSMHSNLLKRIAHVKKLNLGRCPETNARVMKIEDLPGALFDFFREHKVPQASNGRLYVTVAGKNVASFDMPFLKAKIQKWGAVSFLQRTLDPAVLYFDIDQDAKLPDMQTCMDRASIKGTVAHTALEDALTVVLLLRNKLNRTTNK